MKLSENTVNVLKNFSDINQNILVKSGSELQTMSTMKNILGTANVSENFPRNFGIYDLNEFLGVLTLVDSPELKFENDSYLTVNGGYTKIKYFYSDPSILTTPPEVFNPPEVGQSITITEKKLKDVLKASAVMQLPDILIRSDNQTILIEATDVKNTTSNNYTLDLGVTRVGGDFNYHFKADNLKLISGDYELFGSEESGVSNWEGKKASYWIAMEAKAD
ncbi:MAG: hypothetical protein QGH83_07805 [Candidatus Pacebacteria bacterium]|nr:hypothetical protein [Candidatus Paceibacterota bacterium]